MKAFFEHYFKGDKVIWAVLFVLLVLSMLVVYSSTGTLAYKYQSGDTGYYLLRHMKFLIAGLVIVYFVHKIPYRYFYGVTLLLGVSRNDATRWLTLPGIGIEFQTSDLAKFGLILFIARVLAHSQNSKEELKKAYLQIMLPVLLICALILPENLSTSALVFLTSLVLMYIGRIYTPYLLATIGILVAAIAIVLSLIIFAPGTLKRGGTWKNRIENFVKGEGGDNYQAEQAKIAVVTGGLLGKGPGNSTQRNFLPHPYSDFIYAIIIEEYGTLGGVAVLSLYLYLLFRTGRIVRYSKRTFPAFLSIGLSLSLVFQALVNMAVNVGLMPVTGQPLPFVSMGGTSILFTSVAIGILLSISRSIEDQNKQPLPQPLVSNE
jgi:cell division protein FtsW